jgi:hypothetical protein
VIAYSFLFAAKIKRISESLIFRNPYSRKMLRKDQFTKFDFLKKIFYLRKK